MVPCCSDGVTSRVCTVRDMNRERESAFDDPATRVPMRTCHHEFYAGREPGWYQGVARQFSGCQRVLDIGCGPGLLLECLLELGVPDAVGLERDPVFLEMCEAKGLHVIAHDLNSPFPFLETEGFDGVVSYQVFDYITDLAKRIAVREAWRVLKPGGIIHIYSQSRDNERAGQDETRIGRTTPTELAHMLRDAGFEDISLAANALVAVQGRDARDLKREWLLSPRDEYSLTANASARRPPGPARQAVAGVGSLVELWGGSKPPRAFGQFDVAPLRRSENNPLLGPEGGAGWRGLSVRDGTLLATPGKETARANGHLAMFFTAYGGEPPNVTRSIGRAESVAGLTWDCRPEGPVLQAGAPGEWDDGGVAAGSVIALGPSRYLMYYSGRNADTRFLGIGLAESDDTVHWRKLPQNPILTVDDYGDLRHLALADVFRTSTGLWVMHMEGWHLRANGFRVYQARGADPFSFQPASDGEAILDVVQGTWESHHVANPKCLELEPGRYLMAYNGATAALDFQLNFALSEDLGIWRRYSPCPVLSCSYPRISDGYRIESGFMLADEVRAGTPRMWYFGSDTRSVTRGCHILLAEHQHRERTLQWGRYRSAYSSLYQVGPNGLDVLPGAELPHQLLSAALDAREECLVSFAFTSDKRGAHGFCGLGWGDEKPWVMLGTDGSISWYDGERATLWENEAPHRERLAFCVKVKRQREGALTADLAAWANGRLVLEQERSVPSCSADLRFCCGSPHNGPSWRLDHLLFLRTDARPEASR